MVGRQKTDERRERKQQRIDAGPMSDRYPDVASIVVTMDYYKKGSGTASFMHRTVNFFPGSAAYFLMDCMEEKCIDGGYDLESIIYTMVKGHQESSNGELACAGNDCSGHRHIDYRIAIQYS